VERWLYLGTKVIDDYGPQSQEGREEERDRTRVMRYADYSMHHAGRNEKQVSINEE